MRKFYLLFAAFFMGSAVATAGVKNLYKQDFEAVTNVADAGWTSPNLAGGMSLQSTEFGQWFRFDLGGNNNRNAVMNFNYGLEGTTIFGDATDLKEYTVKFQWGLVQNPQSTGTAKNTQFSTEIALLSGSWDSATKGYFVNNGQYATADSLRLFSITQLKGAWQAADDTKDPPVEQTPYWTDENDLSTYAFDFYINGNTEDVITLEQGQWYDITVTVNTEARTISYSIYTLDGTEVKTGEDTISEIADPYAKGINVLLGRYQSIADIDEVKVQVPVEGDYANKPSISLTAVDMAQRSFDIYFEDGEILHIKKTDGTEDTAVESPYEYVTSTSGTLDVWTESGSALSEHATMEVVAEPIKLPAAVVDITKVNEGFVKTLKMTVDNSSVPTQPSITLTYSYNGSTESEEVPSGTTLDVTEKGTLTVTTHAYGFEETSTTFENNTEFAIDNTIDFQHMEEATLLEKGFTEIDPIDSETMSGETNWTARKRLWLGIENGGVDDSGNPTYDTQVVYGPTTTEGASAIRRFLLVPSKLTAESSKTLFAPMYTWYTGEADPAVADGTDIPAAKMNYGIGFINTGVKGDEQTEKITVQNTTIGIDGLTDNDYYIVYVVDNYGGSSAHPIYPQGTSVADAIAQYKASNIGDGTNVQVKRGTETFSLYRIDTAIARIDVFKSVGGTGIQVLPYNEVVSDHNAPIFNMNGVQMNANSLKKGIYVKQGKKFIVR